MLPKQFLIEISLEEIKGFVLGTKHVTFQRTNSRVRVSPFITHLIQLTIQKFLKFIVKLEIKLELDSAYYQEPLVLYY